MNPHELIEKHLRDELSPVEAAALADWLRADYRHAEEFVRAMHVHTVLPEVMADEIPGLAEEPGLADGPGLFAVSARAVEPARAGAGGVRRSLQWAAAAMVLGALGLGLLAYLLRSPDSAAVGRVLEASEGVVISRGEREIAARAGTALLRGDRIRTGPAQRLALMCESGEARVELEDETRVELWSGSERGVLLTRGGLAVAREDRFGSGSFSVGTPYAKADVTGSRFRLAVSGDATRLDMEEGVARLIPPSSGVSREVCEWGYGFARKDREVLIFPPQGRVRWVKTALRLHPDLAVPRGPGVVFDGSLLWLSVNNPSKLCAIDPRNGRMVRILDLQAEFRQIGNLGWDGGRLLVSGPLLDTYRGSELCAVDSLSGKIVERLPCPAQLSHVSAFTSIACERGSLWAVLPQGGRVDQLDLGSGATRKSLYLHHPEITALAWLDGHLWTAGERCLYRMDPADLRVVEFYRNPDLHGVRDMVGGGPGRLWLAGAGGELVLVDLTALSAEPLSEGGRDGGER